MRFSVLSLPLLLLHLSGCTILFGSEDNPSGDADGGTDGSEQCVTRVDGELDFSLPGTYVLDTDDGNLRFPCGAIESLDSETESGVTAFNLPELSLGVDSRLIAIGNNALELRVAGSVTILGTVDLTSRREPRRFAAGSGHNGCTDDSPNPPASGLGGGGGGGGSLGNNGGDGGRGDGDAAQGGGPGFTGGFENVLAGGCPGFDGAPRETGDAGDAGRGGIGGGAIRILAQGIVTVEGAIFAGGSGGSGGKNAAGGGGGGSGGMIWIEAPQIIVEEYGILSAHGGGGGEGASCLDGAHGADAVDLGRVEAAGGASTESDGCGSGDPAGGDGGPGSEGLDDGKNGSDGASQEGGGGGGGSRGIIYMNGTLLNRGFVSPASNLNQ